MIRFVGAKARRELRRLDPAAGLDQVRLILFHGGKPWVYYMLELYRDGAMADAGALVMRNEIKHGLFKALNRIDPEAQGRGQAARRQAGGRALVRREPASRIRIRSCLVEARQIVLARTDRGPTWIATCS